MHQPDSSKSEYDYARVAYTILMLANQTILEAVYQQPLILSMRDHPSTIHRQVALWASGPIVSVKLWHFELAGNYHIWHKAELRGIPKSITVTSFYSSQMLI